MDASARSIDAQLVALAAGHFDAAQPMPLLLDVTGADSTAVARIRALPIITFARTAAELPPGESTAADLTVPERTAASLTAAVHRNPNAALVATQLVRATATLPLPEAIQLESLAYSALQSGPEYRAWHAARTAPATAPAPGHRVTVTTDDGGATILLDRPEHANALDTFARHELVEALTALEYADGPITLRGAGAHFCSGGDLDEFSAHDDILRTHVLRLSQGLPAAFARLGGRIRTHVQGAVIGAGLELSAFTSHITAQRDARFRLPEVRMGLLPGSGGTVSIPRRIGANRALILMLTGSVLTAEQALAWGLVDELAD